MKAADWIDRLKAKRGWESDYRVSKELEVRPQTVSRYRADASTLDDAIAIKVADALGEKPEIVLLDQAIERTKNEDARDALGRVLKRIWGVAAGILLGAVALGSGLGTQDARAGQATKTVATVLHIVSTGRRRGAKRKKRATWVDPIRFGSAVPA